MAGSVNVNLLGSLEFNLSVTILLPSDPVETGLSSTEIPTGPGPENLADNNTSDSILSLEMGSGSKSSAEIVLDDDNDNGINLPFSAPVAANLAKKFRQFSSVLIVRKEVS